MDAHLTIWLIPVLFTLIDMNYLEMLSAREQLMEDIDCIIESNFGEVEYKDDVVRQLCDAVCQNFPTSIIWNYELRCWRTPNLHW